MDPVPLTPDAHERLSQELAWRTGDRRTEISVWIERAREHGDIRENADYDAAKNEQGHNEARVRHLEQLLRAAIVVDGSSAGTVVAGAVVEIRMGESEETTHYLVGSIEERSDDYEVLSTSSPLGRALIGAAPGDVVQYKGPRQTFRVEVISVRALEH